MGRRTDGRLGEMGWRVERGRKGLRRREIRGLVRAGEQRGASEASKTSEVRVVRSLGKTVVVAGDGGWVGGKVGGKRRVWVELAAGETAEVASSHLFPSTVHQTQLHDLQAITVAFHRSVPSDPAAAKECRCLLPLPVSVARSSPRSLSPSRPAR